MSHPFDPDWRVAPGETIKEILLDRNAEGLSMALGLTKEQALGLLDGSTVITEEIAEGLERTLLVSKRFWLNLDAQYRRPITPRADG